MLSVSGGRMVVCMRWLCSLWGQGEAEETLNQRVVGTSNRSRQNTNTFFRPRGPELVPSTSLELSKVHKGP